MMHIERASISTTVVFPTSKGFVMMSSSSSAEAASAQSAQQQEQQSTTSRRPAEPNNVNNNTMQQSTPLLENTSERPEFSFSLDQTDWRDLSSKLSSDTATVFPLLHSKSSASSVWPDTADLVPHCTTSTTSEEEKRIDTSFREEDACSSDPNEQTAVSETFWAFSNTPQNLGNAGEEGGPSNGQLDNHGGGDDDDSSAALSLYLESKLAAVWLEDDSGEKDDEGEADVAHSNSQKVETINRPLHQQTADPLSGSFAMKDGMEQQDETVAEQGETNTLPFIPPPKPLDILSRRQSAPSILHRKNIHDALSVSEHAPPTPPLESVYNPVTGYSPGRAARKRIWGASNAHIPASRSTPDRHSLLATQHSHDSWSDEDSSSVTSEEMLERWSARVRGELRYAELVELAEEAERAADAGEESYTGRPWLCIDGEGGEVLSPKLSQPSIIKRHASYSEGLPMPTSPLKTPRLPQGVQNLRDAEDVFPSFGTFHKNLRTHYLRNKVSEDILVFDEHEPENLFDGDDSGRGLQLAEHRGNNSFGPRDFMNSFNFDMLRGRGRSKEFLDLNGDAKIDLGMAGISSSGSTEDDASDVGEVLAEHIHSADRPARKPSYPMSLPGLPTLEVTQPLTNASTHGTDRQTLPGGQRAIGRAPSVDDDGLVKPRVLFPGGHHPPGLHLPALSIDEESAVPGSPVTPMPKGDTHDFVTPARLREIRRPKGDLEGFVNEQIMILPANSVIQESPFRKTPVCIGSPDRRQIPPGSARVPVKDLLLPAFSTGAEEEAEPLVMLAPSRSYDSLDEDDIAPNPLSSKDRALARQMGGLPPIQPPLTPTKHDVEVSSKTQSPVGSSGVGSDDDGTVITEVKVSILDKSLDSPAASPSRRIIRPSTIQAERALATGQKVFSMKQIVSSTPQGSFDAIDCRCLSPSMDHVHDLLESEEDPGGLRNTTSRTRGALHGAMTMLKKFSPGREKRIVKAQGLFVHPRDNDDFLQNYLYCTKDPKKDEQERHEGLCMTGDHCQNDSFCGAGFAFAYTYCGFTGREGDCAAALGGSRHGNALDILPLALHPHKDYTTEADNWFECATERVDGMLEAFVRGTTQTDDRFQPPSLRKIVRSEARSFRGFTQDALEEEEPETTTDTTPGSMERHPSVQALFKPTEDDLSDTQFALVYGASRSDYHKSAAATTSPLRADVVGQEQALDRHPAIPTSYSSSSDEEVLSVTYISEPSM